ncbi:isocitrate lyase/phosphoenolpyruvate mutase family protein [Salinigranum sp.]|uniref:isocitrate lyase/PEP mutase family protein n=1 Tax=Salinigranum sp. TaxID=1966351 RepID=UPI00356A4A5F
MNGTPDADRPLDSDGDLDTLPDRARAFRDRHTDTGGTGPLLLANAWDCASALVYESVGFEAVGTSSAGIAAAHGVPDGEHLSREEMLAAVERIARCVAVPVSADIEAGYGDSPEAVAETVRGVIHAGAVGVNLEDGTDVDGPLVDTGRHAAVVRAARTAADEAGVPLVVNARTDVFWRSVGEGEERVAHAVERANAYADAGADCLFAPGVTTVDEIERLVAGVDGPVNVLGGPGVPPVSTLGDLGVARVSVGSGPMRATLGHLREVGEELRDEGTYRSMAGAIPYAEVTELLAASVARRGA